MTIRNIASEITFVVAAIGLDHSSSPLAYSILEYSFEHITIPKLEKTLTVRLALFDISFEIGIERADIYAFVVGSPACSVQGW
jgi:hypothetical protein